MALSERLNTPISTAELQRRWRAVRAAMERDKIDVLLMQNNNDHMGGYVRYFTDMPATNGYPNTVIFPRDGEMTVVCQGPFGGGEATAQGDQTWRGVARILIGIGRQGWQSLAIGGQGAFDPVIVAVEKRDHVLFFIEDKPVIGKMVVLRDLFDVLPKSFHRALRTRFLQEHFK